MSKMHDMPFWTNTTVASFKLQSPSIKGQTAIEIYVYRENNGVYVGDNDINGVRTKTQLEMLEQIQREMERVFGEE
jgi:hypothetical protein